MTQREFEMIQRQVRERRARTSFPAPVERRSDVHADGHAQYGAARH